MNDITGHWAAALADAWGIDATLEPLPGEFDLNFRATARDGTAYVLKVMRAECDAAFVSLLCAAHAHIRSRDASVPVPGVIATIAGAPSCVRRDAAGDDRILWLVSWLDGAVYSHFRPHSLSLAADVGETLARLDHALADFAHPALRRDFKWNLLQADWIAGHLGEITDSTRRAIVERVLNRYLSLKPTLLAEPLAVIHNDLNDFNLLIRRPGDGAPAVTGILDFGDMIEGPLVAELAITGAYLALEHPTPERSLAAFIAAYHRVSPLNGAQVDLIWPLLLMRLAVSVTNSAIMQRERPDDPYVVVSQAPAWRCLERAQGIDERLMSARLRAACGLPATDAAARVMSWLDGARGSFAPLMGVALDDAPAASLSVAGSTTPRDPLSMTAAEALSLGTEFGDGTWLGCYAEPRLLYTDRAFLSGPHGNSSRRTVHLGVDVFMPAGTPVHAPLDGVVEAVEYRDRHLDYGGMVVLRHETPMGDRFATLYGHLSRASVAALSVDQHINRDERFASLGTADENGGWTPHLHFQLALLTAGLSADWPGVADPDELAMWRTVCPNPAVLLNLPDDRVAYRPLDTVAIGTGRRDHFAANLKLSYRDPCLFLRGWKHYLFDEWGRPYLDAYNNVPHVGHAHPRLQAVACDQLRRMNSNTRYLHPAQVEFAETLLAKMPSHLTRVFFVNSGSEGNELALRLARAHTGGKDMITPDHGYHGNTTGAYDVSAYKFNRPRGGGRAKWVQVVPVADSYRGEHRGPDAAERFAAYVDKAIDRVHERGGKLAGFIAETLPSVGGQIIPPSGYLAGVYARIRAAGGVCIADEVQTGLGRLGEFYWGFEQQGAQPDIVVIGKPLGNGHPLGAVVTTTDIARSFDNGIEFFSTFGGSTLSCRTGTEVIRIVDEERLQENARVTGERLLGGLRALQSRHAVIGDVRGIGLFIGVDLVTERELRAPATRAASYVVNRLREERILIGTEGPADNVLKIRPPLTVQADDVDLLVSTLDRVLKEAAFLPS